MSSPQAEALVSKIAGLLEGQGVDDYVLVFSDPDSPFDIFRVSGSIFWRTGVGVDILEEAKECRAAQRAEVKDEE